MTDMANSDGEKLPKIPRNFEMRRREYLLSEAPQYLFDAFNASSVIPIEGTLTNGMTLNGVRYRIYRDAAAREEAKRNGIDEWDAYNMENPSVPVDPDDPPADERSPEFYKHEIVQEFARRWYQPSVSWWPLLLSEAQALILEHLIERQEDYAVRPTAAQMVDAAVAFASQNETVSDERFEIMIEALRSKLQ